MGSADGSQLVDPPESATVPAQRDVSTIEAPKDPTAPTPTRSGQMLGVPGATALIIGGVIGTGVFTLPSALAPYGMLAIVALLIVTLGAICVGLLFSKLARRIPRAGGPYSYPHEVFGDFAGFTAAWSFWMTTAIGNAGIVVSWVFYVDVMFGFGDTNNLRDIGIALIGLWIPVAINLIGLDSVRRFQMLTVILKLVPLVFMATVGLAVAITRWEFPAMNPTGETPWFAITAAAALVLFIYIGVEDASSGAARVRDPKRNVPRATVIGTLTCAALYVFSIVAVFGLVSPDALESTGAPFSLAFESIFSFQGAGALIAFFAVVSGLGSLNGLTLLVSEVPRAAAADQLFPRFFTKLTKRDAPWVGLVISTAIASILVIVSYWGQSGLSVFTTLILLTGVTTAVPYFLSAMAGVYLLASQKTRPHWGRFTIDMTISLAAGAFALWAIAGSGATAVEISFLLILAGYVIYVFDRARRSKSGEKLSSS